MTQRKGFTLIELVIVIMILGILAGVAAPKLFNTSQTATDNGVKQSLSVIRDAIELYNAKWGVLPPCNAGGSTFKLAIVPTYLRKMPVCPVGASQTDTITPTTATPMVPDGSTGWMYNTSTGEFIINSTTLSGGGTGPAYNLF